MTDCSEFETEDCMGLAVVRSLDAPRRLDTTQEREDFEQELVDQFLLAAVGAGAGDGTVLENRSVDLRVRGSSGVRCGRLSRRMRMRFWPASAPCWAEHG